MPGKSSTAAWLPKSCPLHLLTHLAALTQSLSNPKFRELNWKLRRADRNMLDAPQWVWKKQKSRSSRNFYTLNGRVHVIVCAVGGCRETGLKSHILQQQSRSHFVTCAFTRRLTQPLLDSQIHSCAHSNRASPAVPLRNISAIARRKRSLGITLGEDRTETRLMLKTTQKHV